MVYMGYTKEVFDAAVTAFIAANVSASPHNLYSPKDYANTVDSARKLATIMMDARNV